MDNWKQYIPVYLRICRTVLLYVVFMLFALLIQVVTGGVLWATIPLLMFVYHSFVRVFAETDRHTRDIFYPYKEEVAAPNRSAEDILSLILHSKAYLLELAILLTLPLFLPPEAGYYSLALPLLTRGWSRAAVKLLMMGSMLPVMFILWLWGHYNAALWWLSPETPYEIPFYRQTALHLLGYSVIYLIGGFGLLFFLPAVGTVIGVLLLLGETFGLWLPLIIVGGVATAVFGFFALRALRIRRKFWKRFQALCREIGATHTKIRRPYRSVFKTDHLPDFILTLSNGKAYHCKMFGALKRHCPLYFGETGLVQCLHVFKLRRVEYFRYTTQLDCSFDAPGPKLLIVNPIPKFIYAGHTEFSRPIDTGESVGDYKVFNATGFLGAMERDVLDR